MNLGELIALARVRLQDKIQPYGWSNQELTEFANAAVTEACDRARLLHANVSIAIIPGTTVYPIPYQVLRYRDGAFIKTGGTNSAQVEQRSDTQYWAAVSAAPLATGDPVIFTEGETLNTISVFPTPATAGVLTLPITRLPTENERMSGTSDEPAIPAEYHRSLVYWMEHEAYTVRDLDLISSPMAARAEQQFIAAFGYRPTARGNIMGKRKIVGSTMYPQRFGG